MLWAAVGTPSSPPPGTSLLFGGEPSSVVTKNPNARAPVALVTNFGTAPGDWVARISPSSQPRHCTVVCGWRSLRKIAVLRRTLAPHREAFAPLARSDFEVDERLRLLAVRNLLAQVAGLGRFERVVDVRQERAECQTRHDWSPFVPHKQ